MTDYTRPLVNIGYLTSQIFMKKKATKQTGEPEKPTKGSKKPITFRPSKELQELFDEAARLGLNQTDLINQALQRSGESIILETAKYRLQEAKQIIHVKGHVTGNG